MAYQRQQANHIPTDIFSATNLTSLFILENIEEPFSGKTEGSSGDPTYVVYLDTHTHTHTHTLTHTHTPLPTHPHETVKKVKKTYSDGKREENGEGLLSR